ncbi:MAG: hypothetical protein U1F11_00320 [Steroidobacteraceae bacterium]
MEIIVEVKRDLRRITLDNRWRDPRHALSWRRWCGSRSTAGMYVDLLDKLAAGASRLRYLGTAAF